MSLYFNNIYRCVYISSRYIFVYCKDKPYSFLFNGKYPYPYVTCMYVYIVHTSLYIFSLPKTVRFKKFCR